MKRYELQRIDEILGLWISYKEKQKEIHGIINSGPTVGGKWLEFKGDFPQLSDFKPDALSGKAERMRKVYITDEEKRAHTLVEAFPNKLRNILTKHREKRGKNCPLTNTKWTHENIAFCLKIRFERYEVVRAYLCKLLLDVDAKTNYSIQAKVLHQSLLQLNY